VVDDAHKISTRSFETEVVDISTRPTRPPRRPHLVQLASPSHSTTMHTSYTVYIPPALPYLARHSQASGAITSPSQGQARSRKRSHEPGNSCDGLYFRPILPLPDTQELALRSHQQLGLVETRVAVTATTSVPITTPCQTSLSAQQLQPISPPPSSKRQRVQPLKPINSKSSLTAVPTPTGAERYDDTIIADSEGGSEGSEDEEEDVYGGAVDSGGGGGTFDITKTGRERWDTTVHTTERSRRDKNALEYTGQFVVPWWSSSTSIRMHTLTCYSLIHQQRHTLILL
jgi:hypothetical protein